MELQAVQALLEHDAECCSAPFGLSARVYEASIGLLPGRVPAGRSWRPWEAAAIGRIPAWGRLALAASIALAFGLATQLPLGRSFAPPPALSVAEILVLDEDFAGLEYAAGSSTEGIEDLVLTGDMTLDDLDADVAIVELLAHDLDT